MPMPHVEGKGDFYVKIKLADVKRAFYPLTERLSVWPGWKHEDVWQEKDLNELPPPPAGQRWIAVALAGKNYWFREKQTRK